MKDALQKILDQTAAAIERRTSIFDVKLEDYSSEEAIFSGRVLQHSQLEALRQKLMDAYPGLKLDTSQVRMLEEGSGNFHVSTNLTGLYEKPSFGVPLASELYYGTGLKTLEEHERWVYIQQLDGYLGWAYKPYLQEGEAPASTHLVLAPSLEVWDDPEMQGNILTRLVSGTAVAVEEFRQDWARVRANKTGWVPANQLRSLDELPATTEQRRASIVQDAARMIGTPYLWGGMSGNGIDCSGLAMLVHRWIGIAIPRDADMQCTAAHPVHEPFEIGDLFFFGEGNGERHVTHVGICLGGWKVIHSSRTRNGVYIDDVQEAEYLREIYMSAGSFLRQS